MNRRAPPHYSLDPQKLEILETITHGKRKEIFLSIAKTDRTFSELLDDLKISKSGLSTALSKLSRAGIITPHFRDVQVKYTLTVLGDLIRYYIELCTASITELETIKAKRIALSAEDMIKLMEEYDSVTFKHLFNGWKIVLPSAHYEKVLDYLNKKILEPEADKFEEFEDLLFSEKIVYVPKTYENPEETVRVEYYLRKQKKLSIANAEMIAVATDQNAIVISSDSEIIKTGLEIGVKAIIIDKLEDFLKKQKLKVIRTTSIKTSMSDYYKTSLTKWNTGKPTTKPSAFTKTDKGISGKIKLIQES